MPLSNRCAAEFIGTFWLVLGGCGSAVLAAAFPQVGIGLMGVSFAFGLTVLTMAYAFGHVILAVERAEATAPNRNAQSRKFVGRMRIPARVSFTA